MSKSALETKKSTLSAMHGSAPNDNVFLNALSSTIGLRLVIHLFSFQVSRA